MLMVVVLNYYMFIVFSINHVLVFLFAVRKKKWKKKCYFKYPSSARQGFPTL